MVPRADLLPITVIGKLYRKKSLAVSMYRRIEDLSRRLSHSRGPVSIPAPLMLASRLGVILQEHIQGHDLRHILAPNYEDPLAQAAKWLAKLHSARPLHGLNVMSIQHELEKVDRWCEDISAHLSAAGERRVHRAKDALNGIARKMPPYTPAMIHKDFYYANVLWDGRGIWALDFDRLSIGDPSFDVGHFIAHLENLAYRTTGRLDSYSRQSAFFVNSYLKRNPVELRSRLPFYMAYTFLKPESTEGGRRVSVLRRQEGAPVLLG